MDNLKYLEEIKKADEDYRKLHNIKLDGFVIDKEGDSYRQAKALEIIAEELINNNSTLRTLVTTLENIETAIRQGGL